MSILVKVLDKKAKIIEKPSAMIKRKEYFYLRSIANFIALHALHMFGFSMKIVMLTTYCSMQVLFLAKRLHLSFSHVVPIATLFFKLIACI
jgi:hypothetical protein